MEFSKVPLSLRLHNFPTLQLLLQKALPNTFYLSHSKKVDSTWRASDLKMNFLDGATRESDWFVSRGCLRTMRLKEIDVTLNRPQIPFE